MPKKASYEERFWEKVMTEPMSGCWIWIGNQNSGGYGQMNVGGKMRYAHRISYEMYRAPIPEGLCIDHLCRTRSCVNPFHLEPVTPQENHRRGMKATAKFCKRGHAFMPKDTILRSGTNRTRRRCHVCANEIRRVGHRSAG